MGEVAARYDFRKTKTEITMSKKDKSIHMVTEDDMKMEALREMLIAHCVKRKVDPKFLEFKEIEATLSMREVKRDVVIKEGLSKDTAQRIVKFIKGLKLKVQSAIQEDQVRVTGKQIDDLQAVMKVLKEQDYDVPLQFVNLKR
jgi:uncharacterized protein YajQ (UPF0234 family)